MEVGTNGNPKSSVIPSSCRTLMGEKKKEWGGGFVELFKLTTASGERIVRGDLSKIVKM